MVSVNDINPQMIQALIDRVDLLEKMLYNYDAKGIVQGTIKGIRIIQVTDNTTNGKVLSESYKNNNGGLHTIYDNNGNLNVKIGSENGTAANNGGTIILYNDSEYAPRVELGISVAYGSGTINLKDSTGTVRAVLYADSNIGPVVALRDGAGNTTTYLTQYEGKINNQTVATQEWVLSQGYSTYVPPPSP